jgi:hypothetical protein
MVARGRGARFVFQAFAVVAVALSSGVAAADGSGRLVVISGVPGATVTLDDRPIGRTPLDEIVGVGVHRLAVALDGYEPVSSRVDVDAAKVNQVYVPLEPVAPVRRVGKIVGVAAGADGLDAPRRVEAWVGLRDPWDHLEGGLLFVGDRSEVRLGAVTRLYLLTETIRPYARGAVLAAPGPALVVEGGAGLAIGQFSAAAGRDFFLFVEGDARWRAGAFAIPINIGVMARL